MIGWSFSFQDSLKEYINTELEVISERTVSTGDMDKYCILQKNRKIGNHTHERKQLIR